MKWIVLFITAVVLLIFYSGIKSHGEITTELAETGLSQGCVQWYDRGIKKRAWMAPDEMALILGETRESENRLSFVQGHYPDAVVTEKDNYMAHLKFYKALDIKRQLRDMSSSGLLYPVFYKSRDRRESGRMVLIGEIILQYPEFFIIERIGEIEKEYGIERLRQFDFAKNTFLYRVDDPLNSLDIASLLIESGLVNYAYPHWLRAANKRAIPDDPLFPDQWHLKNTGQGDGTYGEDINIVSAWDTYRGSQQEIIAIVDYDGMEIDHEDLYVNILADKCWDFVDADGDPTPVSSSDYHGTSCGGLAAGRGFNDQGICGVAPYAGLVGYRIPEGLSDVNESLALSRDSQVVDIYSNSWGPLDPSYIFESPVLDGPGELLEDAIKDCVRNGRQGLGNIYIWAGGNGGQFGDNSNYDGYASSRYTIAVAATTQNGKKAIYSEEGANIMINAPAGTLTFGLTTTDLTGVRGDNYQNYTYSFGGTSASAPLVAGVIALMLEANPALTWRDVQHIIIETAEKNDPSDDGWIKNGAGHDINHKYGFGRIDAKAAIEAAGFWNSARPEKIVEYSCSANTEIPNNDAAGVSSTIFIEDDLKVEFVDIYFSASNHDSWGDLEIALTSPAGTESILAQKHSSDHSHRYENWRFGSIRHYGEYSKGDWTIKVKDLEGGFNSGTLQSWGLKIYGTETYPSGDLAPYGNRDGQVNVGDALVALRFALGLDSPTQEDMQYGDVAPLGSDGRPDPDGVITLGDALIILRKALGTVFF